MNAITRMLEMISEAKHNKKTLHSFHPTPEDYREILSHPALFTIPSKPEPPIKTTEVSHSLFSHSRRVEYDHSAPEYLEALARWKEECRERSSKPPMLFGVEILPPAA